MSRLLCLTLLLLVVAACAPPAEEQAPGLDLPESKRTELGLYVTATEAYARWKADSTGVRILDVRTPEEYIFVGHPPMARNIPLRFVEHAWDAEKRRPVMPPNPKFVDEVKQAYQPDDTIMVICRSGSRSAAAVNLLTKAGFEKLYAVTDGFEGDRVKGPDASSFGTKTINGWRNSNMPWTYDLDPELMYLPTDDKSSGSEME